MFEIVKEDDHSRARVGRLKTPHGVVETPSYVIVGTNAEVRFVEPTDLPATKTQMIIANTYHLWRQLGEEGLNDYQGLHSAMSWQGPIMTDSGGFQVFSLGASREHGAGKVEQAEKSDFKSGESMVRVTESGVYFMEDGEEHYLDAEISMKIQEQLGADIIFAFDEPSSPQHDYEYTKSAMRRTHEWAVRSLEAKQSEQWLYGIVQGGSFEDLRKESAKYIGELPFYGFGIGGSFGTSFGSTKAEMFRELDWTIPFLPREKPRHFLGIGKVEDLFYGVEAGIDTFDCVIPTREGRHGALWTATGRVDITKGSFNGSDEPLEDICGCVACLRGVSRGQLHQMFRDRNPEAPKLASIHNIYFFNNLMEQIRDSIKAGEFSDFKKTYLASFSRGVDK